jgi:hypothetical protein
MARKQTSPPTNGAVWQTRITGHGNATLDALPPNARNPRRHPPAQQAALAGVLQDIGLIQTVIVNQRTGDAWPETERGQAVLLDGHLRVALAQEVGQADLPVTYVDLDPAQEAEALATLDPVTGLATYDAPTLAALLRDVQSGEAGVQALLADLADREGLTPAPEGAGDGEGLDDAPVDRAEEFRQQWGVEVGQVWALGDHRIVCGDCREAEILGWLLRPDVPQMVLTDPPYGIALDSSKSNNITWNFPRSHFPVRSKSYRPIVGDEQPFDPRPFLEAFAAAREQFWWGADNYRSFLPAEPQGAWFVWDKSRNETSDHSIKSRGAAFELCWSKAPHARQIIRVLWRGIMGTETQDFRERIHPTQKPVQVMAFFVEQFAPDGGIVVDPFLGSGTTLIACERLGRVCRGIEIDPGYVSVCLERWHQLTNEMPRLVEE